MKKKGFTLIEMLVVLVITGILLTFTITGIQSGQRKTRDITRKADLQIIANALLSYGDDYGHFPESIYMLNSDKTIENLESELGGIAYNYNTFNYGIKLTYLGNNDVMLFENKCGNYMLYNERNDSCICYPGYYNTNNNACAPIDKLYCEQNNGNRNEEINTCKCTENNGGFNGYSCVDITNNYCENLGLDTDGVGCMCEDGATWDNDIGRCTCGDVNQYYNGNNCINIDDTYCDGLGLTYDGESCKCEDGLEWNQEKNSCIITASYCENLGLDTDGESCICTIESQIFNGYECICTDGQILDSDNNNCVNINEYCENLGLDTDGEGCECKNGATWNQNKKSCECGNGATWDQNKNSCECGNGATWNGSSCICPNNKNWNQSRQTCECPDGTQSDGNGCKAIPTEGDDGDDGDSGSEGDSGNEGNNRNNGNGQFISNFARLIGNDGGIKNETNFSITSYGMSTNLLKELVDEGYLESIPSDPSNTHTNITTKDCGNGTGSACAYICPSGYVYMSDGKHFALVARMENDDSGNYNGSLELLSKLADNFNDDNWQDVYNNTTEYNTGEYYVIMY